MVERAGFYWVNDVDALRGNPARFVDYLPAVNALGLSALVMAGCEMIPEGLLIPETQDFVGRARRAGHQVSLDLGWHRLVNDPPRQERMLAALDQIIRPDHLEPMVYSFSLDEPDTAGAASFREFTRQLKERFPFVRVQVVYALPNLASMAADMNDFVDDIGFDWYFWVPDFDGFDRWYRVTEEIASKGQRIWLYPETFVYSADLARAADFQTYIRDILPYYHDFARRHPRVHGVFYFLWAAPAAGEIALGLRQFSDPASPYFDPAIRDLVAEFGREVAAAA
jgi:hypothetical protein